MATTYDYQTGKIERDFKFVRYGENVNAADCLVMQVQLTVVKNASIMVV